MSLPPQHQDRQPGLQEEMNPQPASIKQAHQGTGKLQDKVAIITGGDSGIGRAVAVTFAREGASIAVMYLNEHSDAEETKRLVEQEGAKCILLPGDVGNKQFCQEAVDQAVSQYGGLDILINNAGEQHPQQDISAITEEQLVRTFRTNIFAHFFMVQAALPHLKQGSAIVNTTSVTAYRGSSHLLDYASTKGAIVAFTRSLSQALVEEKIRVNAVAPGPIWTPLIPSTFPADQVKDFGGDTPMKRAGQPEEVAPAYLYLASSDSSYVTGQVLHVNGGEIVNG